MRCHMVRKTITKHARKRFIERIGYLSDEEMLWFASIPNKMYKFIWKWNRIFTKNGTVLERRLITVIATGQDR